MGRPCQDGRACSLVLVRVNRPRLSRRSLVEDCRDKIPCSLVAGEHDIMISYRVNDTGMPERGNGDGTAIKVRDALSNYGFHAYLDIVKLEAGDNWKEVGRL